MNRRYYTKQSIKSGHVGGTARMANLIKMRLPVSPYFLSRATSELTF